MAGLEVLHVLERQAVAAVEHDQHPGRVETDLRREAHQAARAPVRSETVTTNIG